MFSERGTIGPCFQGVSVFLMQRPLKGLVWLVNGLYLRALDAGKLNEKYNSGTKPRSGSRGKSLDTSTAGPPLHSTQEYCSPTHAGGLPTGTNCSSQSDFPKDTIKECSGQLRGRDSVHVFEYFYVAVSSRAGFHVPYCE